MNREYTKRIKRANDAANEFFEAVKKSGSIAMLDEDEKVVDLFLEAFDAATDASEEERDFYFNITDYYHYRMLFLLHAGEIEKATGGKKTLTAKDLQPFYEVVTQYLDNAIEQNDRLKPDYIERKNEVISDINDELEQCGFTIKKGGCYVATAVYGSYDCPQVWTLRRYRDSRLANRLWGRLFIRAYYAVSPTMVKWFGGQAWFGKLFRRPLDTFVRRLHDMGYEDTPYSDYAPRAERHKFR